MSQVASKNARRGGGQLTREETQYLSETCGKLTNDQRRKILKSQGLSASGNKDELTNRIKEGLEHGSIALAPLMMELDSILPWWRFHVFLYNAPAITPKSWRKLEFVEAHLESSGVLHLLNAQIPLVLPGVLTLTSISYSPDRLRATAVQRREYTERDETLDPDDGVVGDNTVEFRAFVKQVARGMVSFEWDFSAKTAMIQITELPSGAKYETVRDNFFTLIASWLAFDGFEAINVAKAVGALHESEKNNEGEVRSHGIEYRTIEGRRLAARSQAISNSVLGEDVIDESLDRIREEGVGHTGNFYWLPTDGTGANTDLEREIHVVILGDKNRVSMRTRSSTDTTEQEMRHVLSRLRELSS